MSTPCNVLTELVEINKKASWAQVFQKICSESSDSACAESQKLKNKYLNRYRDVNPFDKTRIILQKGLCDYINANLVKVERANRSYILTQGPLEPTVVHFWQMVWEQNSQAIIMLNKIVEKKQVKCHWYWPKEKGDQHALCFNEIGLTVTYEEHQDFSYYSTRKFRITDINSKESRDITQYHYTTWPDFGVPGSPTAFLEFLQLVRKSGALDEDVGPAVVHCSAGIGRSGTFCLVDSCLVMIEKYGIDSVDVKQVLLEMRKFRMGLIQTADQLRFSYQAIVKGLNGLPDLSESIPLNPQLSETPEEAPDEPPLPPPRGSSLHHSEASNNLDHEKEIPAEPEEPSSEKNQNDNVSCGSSSDATAELRKRKRETRNNQMNAKIEDIKRRRRSAEKWNRVKRSLLKPCALGACALVVGTGLLFYFLNKY